MDADLELRACVPEPIQLSGFNQESQILMDAQSSVFFKR